MTTLQREATMYQWVHDAAKSIMAGSVAWKLQDHYRSGVPDQLLCVMGRVAWVESKLIKTARPQVLGHTASQFSALKAWWRAGGVAGLLVGWKDRLYWVDAQVIPTPVKVVDPDELASSTVWLPGRIIMDEQSRDGCERIVRHITRAP